MCGICGAFSFDSRPLIADSLKGMCDVIAHRGPDDAGYLVGTHSEEALVAFTDNDFHTQNPHLMPIDSYLGEKMLHSHQWSCFLGQRRLSILDVSHHAHQPMGDTLKDVWLVYNGELYNYRELQATLESLGYRFQSSGDTEVVLAAYREWGIDAVERFNGMFALAIWDRRTGQLHLARDRYGIKPLYYCHHDSLFVFGSEAKAILAYPDIKAQLDYEALMEYFTFQNLFRDATLFEGITLLPPAHVLTCDLATKNVQTRRYWDYHFESHLALSQPELLRELDQLFSQAVERQLISDVELGSYLSGGIDSGSIAGVAAAHLPHLKTFTVGFDRMSQSGLEMGFDEREQSEYLSYLFKTEHYEMVLKAGDMERCLAEFSWHLEEPRVGQSYPNFYASKLASKFVKVALAGAGGDELFAGYPWRYYRTLESRDFNDYIDDYYGFWQRLIPNTLLHQVFAPIQEKTKHVWTRDIFADVFAHHANRLTRPEDYIQHSLYFEAKTFLHGLLVVEDKLSMAHGLETRVPFLDNDLVDFAMQVPLHYKLRNLDEIIRQNENNIGPKKRRYYQKTNDGKILLRQMSEKHIGPRISNLVKQGFSAPDEAWFKGESIDFVRETLYPDSARIYELFDKKAIRALMDEHLSGQKNRRLLIWSLLNFEYFLKSFRVAV